MYSQDSHLGESIVSVGKLDFGTLYVGDLF